MSFFLGPSSSLVSLTYLRAGRQGSGLSSAGCGLFSGSVCVLPIHLWEEMGFLPFLTSGSMGSGGRNPFCILLIDIFTMETVGFLSNPFF